MTKSCHDLVAHCLLRPRPTKARDFEGPGGPETKQALYEEANPGNDDVTSNVRQGNETVRPAGQMSGHGTYGSS